MSLPIHDNTPAGDFPSSLRQALQAYLQESHLSIEFVAELCNSSKRNLQRKLAVAGTRYSEILDQVRFNTASELLQDPDIKITDITHQLGYSDSAHFTRAFRRNTGAPPACFASNTRINYRPPSRLRQISSTRTAREMAMQGAMRIAPCRRGRTLSPDQDTRAT